MKNTATIAMLAIMSGAAFGGIVAIDDGLVKSIPQTNDPLAGFGEADYVQGFAERSDITLTNDVHIQLGDGSTGILAAGTVVSSHMVYFDPLAASGLLSVSDISVMFDSQILGLVTDVTEMSATNDLLGLDSLNYYYGSNQGYGANGEFDLEFFSGSTLNLSLLSRSGDYIRVLTVGTAGVPTPGSLALLSVGGMIGLRRRR